MKVSILTLFPDFIRSCISYSMLKKAIDNKHLEVLIYDIRDYTTDKHRNVDDVPYGGGAGMVMLAEPLYNCIMAAKKEYNDAVPVVYLTPAGKTLTQIDSELYATKWSKSGVIMLCGHYEGIDERIRNMFVTDEISIGNYVLTGGELASMVLLDSVCRLQEGILGNSDSHHFESFSMGYNRKIEHPHYTRPASFMGLEVPPVLLSGNHKAIVQWRMDNCKEPL